MRWTLKEICFLNEDDRRSRIVGNRKSRSFFFFPICRWERRFTRARESFGKFSRSEERWTSSHKGGSWRERGHRQDHSFETDAHWQRSRLVKCTPAKSVHTRNSLPLRFSVAPPPRAARERKDSGSQPSVPATTPTYVPGDSRVMQREFRNSNEYIRFRDSFSILENKFSTSYSYSIHNTNNYIYTLYLSSIDNTGNIYLARIFILNQVL